MHKVLTISFLVIIIASLGFATIHWSYLGLTYGRSVSDAYFNRDKALNFLVSLNDSSHGGLLHEYNGSKNFWMYNDNALAYQILLDFGRNQTAEKIGNTMEKIWKNCSNYLYGNDRIEVLFNKSISYPPYTSTGYHYSPIIDHDMELDSNLVYNPSVELGSQYPDCWFQSDPNLIKTPWSTKYSRSGGRSIGLNVTCEDADWRSSTFPVEPLKSYLVRCYVKGNVTSGNWFVYIRWFNSSQPMSENWIGQNFTQICPEHYSNWTQMVLFDFVCPSEARYADIRFLARNGTGELYADDFEMEKIITFGTFIIRNDRKYMQIPDWQEYADLSVFGIIDKWLNNRTAEAIDNYTTLINSMCKPEGVIDKSFDGKYDTYKVALVLICSKIINQSFSLYDNYTQILCKMQMPDGGVKTNYLLTPSGIIPDPEAKENVETTCLAIYALNEPPKPWILIPEFPDALTLLICMSLSIIVALARRKFVRATSPVEWIKKVKGKDVNG